MSKNVERMLSDIRNEVVYTRHMIGRNDLRPEVLEAMRTVPREEFVPDELKSFAYDNGPLSIGYGQTISQPYIVALMTDLLQLDPTHVVLEIGTGSGYQTAILSRLDKKVFSIEVIQALAEETERRLGKLKFSNIETRVSDGYAGWPEHAPYDAIIVTAAATHIPQPLLEQLKCGGKLVIPVGQPYSSQKLMLVEKNMQGKTHVKNILGVVFVPLITKSIQENTKILH